jgi:hypothetical protein
MRSLTVVAAGLALGIGAAAFVIARGGGGDEATRVAVRPAPPAPRESRAGEDGSRRVLTAAQTERLAQYATSLHSCLRRRGIDVDTPSKDARAITIKAAKAVGLERLVTLTTSCAAPLGDPPKPASLQAVDARTIALSVPKQCLLDPKVELTAR